MTRLWEIMHDCYTLNACRVRARVVHVVRSVGVRRGMV